MVFAESTAIPRYWMPLQPTIEIFPKSEFTYDLQKALYIYNPGVEVGSSNPQSYTTLSYDSSYQVFARIISASQIAKPIALQFESTIGNVGTFRLEIEDSGYTLDPDLFSRGDRVFILCTKNNQDPQAGFKGLVRSIEQKMYGRNGRNIIIKGYSYLIRLKERIVDYSALNFPTDTLIQALLNDDSVYLYTNAEVPQFTNDTILHADHAWPVDQVIPNAKAQLATLDQAISDVTEHTNSLVGLDFNLDQLILYTSDDTVVGDNQIFTITDKLDQFSDRADTTMYTLEPYTYSFGYDYPDSASRLIASIGNNACNPSATPIGGGDPSWLESDWTSAVELADDSVNTNNALAIPFVASSASSQNMKLGLTSIGNASFMNFAYMAFLSNDVLNGVSYPKVFQGTGTGWYPCYRHGVPGTAFPSIDTTNFWVGFDSGSNVGAEVVLTPNVKYWVALKASGAVFLANSIAWIHDNETSSWAYSNDHLASVSVTSGDQSGATHAFRMDYKQGAVLGGSDCGGPPNTADVSPNFLIAADMNGVNRIGIVEKTITGLPESIRNQQSMNEYMFNKIYTSAKPKFRFDYPAVTLPNIMPRAGDIVVHRDSRMNVGVAGAPIQTGIINNVNYDFRQDEQGVLGITRIAISTSGVMRGSY